MCVVRVRDRRRGFEVRIESNWWVVGVGDGSLIVRDRVVRPVVRDPKSSQDEIVTPVERLRYHNLGKRWRAKNLEMSTCSKLIDSMLLSRTSSSSGVKVEIMEVGRGPFKFGPQR